MTPIPNYALLIWSVAILIICFDIVIITGSKKLSSFLFAIFSFFTAVWVISQGFFLVTSAENIANLLIRFQYCCGAIITSGFYLFSVTYPDKRIVNRREVILLSIITLLFIILFFYSNLMINSVYQIDNISRWAWNFGPTSLIFDFYFYIIWTIILTNLYKTHKIDFEKTQKNSSNMFWALLLGIFPPAISNIFLPSIGIYTFNSIGPTTSIIWITIITYSIIKHNQLNLKIVMTKVLSLWVLIIFILEIIVSGLPHPKLRIIVVIIFLSLIYYLFKSVIKESATSDNLKFINNILEQRVAEQTAELQRSYELEKKARRELEKLNETKDQFIMITQHHLRSPVVTIQNELKKIELKLQSDSDEKIIEHLNEAKSSTIRLSKLVDDFLNISTLKVGSKILNINKGNIKPLIEDILAELKFDIRNLNLTIEFDKTDKNWPDLRIDSNKIREALLIVIENAVKYNIKNGSIKISSNLFYDTLELSVENTGVGITYDERNKLFSKLFFRGNRAKVSHPIGMGIGLSVARAIIRAHHGDIDIFSKGEGEGARATISLPIDFIKRINAENNF